MKAWELLSDGSKWTRATMARNANGMPCASDSPSAHSWCAAGAIAHCYGHDSIRPLERVAALLDGYCLTAFNDDKGYEAVMKILKEADV